MKSVKDYEFGSREPTPINLLLLISDLEGAYQYLKYMGFEDDMKVLEALKTKYHKLYFKSKKQAG